METASELLTLNQFAEILKLGGIFAIYLIPVTAITLTTGIILRKRRVAKLKKKQQEELEKQRKEAAKKQTEQIKNEAKQGKTKEDKIDLSELQLEDVEDILNTGENTRNHKGDSLYLEFDMKGNIK